MHPSWLSYLLCHTGPDTFCSMSSQLSLMSVFTPLQSLVKNYLDSLLYLEMTEIISWISVVACLLVPYISGIQAYALPEDYFTKEWNAGASEKTLIFVKFQVCILHTLNPLSNTASWSLPCSSKPAIKLSSTLPKMFSILLNNLSTSSATYHLLVSLQMAILYICTCQMDKKMLSSMTIFCLILDYDNLNYHWWMWGI